MTDSIKQPFFSIIIPVYNGQSKIIRCLDSVLEQEYRDFECIIIDDGSKDDSVTLISDYLKEKKDNRFRLIKKENSGVSETRNLGIKEAKGCYVTFMDQDDYVARDYLYRFFKKTEENDYDVVTTGFARVDEKDKRELYATSLTEDFWSEFLVISPWDHIYKKSFLDAYGIRFLTTPIGEDLYFNLVARSYTSNVAVIPDYTGYYWVDNQSSVSNVKQKKISKTENPLFLLQKIHQDFSKQNQIPYDIREYYFTRYITWYLFFTVRSSEKEVFFEMEEELYQWLKREYPKYSKNPYLKKRIPGELSNFYWATKGLLFLRKLKLDHLMFRFFMKL